MIFSWTHGVSNESFLKQPDDITQEDEQQLEPSLPPPPEVPPLALGDDEDDDNAVAKDEILRFPTNCPDCNAPAETNMKVTGESISTSV